MSTRLQLAATLFCLNLPMVLAAHSQSCTELLRKAAAHQSGHTVSAANLRIPQKAWKHFEKARAASERNQTEVFDREVAQALTDAPQFAEVYLLRATRELHDGHLDAAIASIVAARQIQQDLPWSGVTMASILNGLHRYGEAVAELDRARGEEADSWQDRYERARAETGLQNAEAALHWSELAVTAAPVGCTDVRIVRANAFQIAGRPSKAVVELETYLALDRMGNHRSEVLAMIERVKGSGQGQDEGLVAMR